MTSDADRLAQIRRDMAARYWTNDSNARWLLGQYDELLATLMDVVNQACFTDEGLHPLGLSAYEGAFAVLERLGKVERKDRYHWQWVQEAAK